jgi:molecular chaperone GrpE
MTDKHHKKTKGETVSKDQHLRLAADFDNYRKAAERQMEDIVKFGQVGLLTEFLDALDLVDRAVATAPEIVRSDEWFAGLEQVRKRFLGTLEKFGVRRLETIGKDLDPTTMEVVATSDGEPSQQVKEEVRAGYMLHDRIIRPARVIVYQ